MIGWVSSGIPVWLFGYRDQRVHSGELAGGGVVVAGSEVYVAGSKNISNGSAFAI